MKYFCHIRMKSILEGKIGGKRARGRLRHKWDNNINVKGWTNSSLSEFTTRAGDSVRDNLHHGDGTWLFD